MEFLNDMAVLNIEDAGARVEVRGHPAVGSVYEGSHLDRILAGLSLGHQTGTDEFSFLRQMEKLRLISWTAAFHPQFVFLASR